MPGRAAVILGWDREDREGWEIRVVRVGARRVREWDRESQGPMVLYMRPGERRLTLYAGRSPDRSRRGSGRGRRYRLRPVSISLAEGDVHLCVVRVAGERRRPELSCMARVSAAGGPASRRVEEDEDESGLFDLFDPPRSPRRGAELVASPYSPPARAGADDEHAVYELFDREGASPRVSELVVSPYAPPERAGEEEPGHGVGDADALAGGSPTGSPDQEARLERLERRIERLERLLERLLLEGRVAPRSPRTGGAHREPEIDTTPPW